MNNAQIIFNESVELMKNGLIGTTGRKITIEYEKDGEKVKETINEPEPIHTYAEWKKAGFQVQKGQKAVASFTIWMWTEKTGKLTKEQADSINTVMINADGSKAQEGDEVKSGGHYYLKKASFFKASQVAPIKEAPQEKAPELETVDSYVIDENYINNLLVNA
jgi:hypothetical protein